MADIKWTGLGHSPLDNNYRDGGNWSGGHVPSRTDDVKLGGSGYTVNLSPGKTDAFYLNSLQINKGVTLLVHDANGQFNPDDTSLHVIGQINNKGSIQLAGGSVTGDYTDTVKSIISGYGNLSVNGTITGKIIATQQGTGLLSIQQGNLEGKLTGTGTAELGYGVTVVDGAQVTVANLRLNGATVNTDLDLTHSNVMLDGSLQTKGHTISIDGGEINSGQIFGGGTLINTGHIMATGFNLNGNLVNDGQIDFKGLSYPTFNLAGTISGSGTITLGEGARFVDEGYTGGNGHGVVLAGNTFALTTNSTIVFSDDADHDFHADISGLGGSNRLELDYSGFVAHSQDLPDVSYTADAGGHSGTLNISSPYDHLAVHLLGNYATSGFAISEDDHANLLVSYQTATASDDAFSSGSFIHT